MVNVDAFKLATVEERGGEYVRRLIDDFSLTPEQAAGIVGNLLFESNGFKELQERQPAVPGSRGGGGIAMWTASRRVAFEAWAAAHHLDVSSDAANYGYLCEELRGAYKSTITALRQRTTLDDAVWSFGQTFERPGGTTTSNLPGFASRLAYAKRALAGAKAQGGADPVIPAPTSPPIDQDLLADVVRAAQRIVGVTPDGRLGPVSTAAIQSAQRRPT